MSELSIKFTLPSPSQGLGLAAIAGQLHLAQRNLVYGPNGLEVYYLLFANTP